MTMMEAIKVVAALRKSAVFEPLAAVVALYELATITVLETTTSRSAIEVAACRKIADHYRGGHHSHGHRHGWRSRHHRADATA